MAMFDFETWRNNIDSLDKLEPGTPVKCGYPLTAETIVGRYIANQGSSNMYISTPHGTLIRFTLPQCDFDLTEEDLQKLKDYEKMAIESNSWYLKEIKSETINECGIRIKSEDIKPLE